MSATQKELIAQRDELIGMLEGEWAIDKDWKSIRGKAFRVGLTIFLGGMIFSCIIFPIAYVSAKLKGTLNIQASGLELVGTMAAFMFIIGAIGFGCAMIQAWIYRNSEPIVVDAKLLSWDRGKGHVTELLHLESLRRVSDLVSSGGAGGSVIARMLGSSAMQYSKHLLISEHDKNTPKITPGVFSEGVLLVKLLKELAAINTKINELNAAKEPAA